MTARAWPLLLAVVAGCGSGSTGVPPLEDVARIDRVLGGLRPVIAIKGEPPLRWTLADRMTHYRVPGISIAVIDSGRIAWASGYDVKAAGGADSVTAETLFQAGSISKPTFALAVMRLVQDGKLDLDEDVNLKLTSWKVPENRFTAANKVTLRRILSHSAGLTVHGFPGYPVGAPVPTVPQILDGEQPANTGPVRVDTFPGAISRYSGGGTTVAMLLATDVTQIPFPALMRRMVLEPAGMKHSTYEQPLPAALAAAAASGHTSRGTIVPGRYHTYPEMAAAGLWTTAVDLAKLAIELQATYAGRSSKVIDPATFKAMLVPQKAGFGIGYHLQGSGPDLEFAHDGADEGFTALFLAFSERGQGLMVMTNGDGGALLIGEVIESVAAEYRWPADEQSERTVVPVEATTLAEIAGDYQIDFGGAEPVVVSVTVEDGKLYLEAKAGPFRRDRLLADSDSTFFGRESGHPVQFDRAKGRVVGITMGGSLRGRKIVPR